jgi:uncharacterized protein (UPF0548 family)
MRTSDDDAFSYIEVGATAGAVLPAGYSHVRRATVIGRGEAVFAAAAGDLLHWQVQRGAGLTVRAADEVTVGGLVWMGLGVGPVKVGFRCRVVDVVDEPRRKGFSYGTLRGHPEAGEEAFTVVWRDDDAVELQIVAFSRPAHWWIKLGGPVPGLVQSWMTGRYLKALA